MKQLDPGNETGHSALDVFLAIIASFVKHTFGEKEPTADTSTRIAILQALEEGDKTAYQLSRWVKEHQPEIISNPANERMFSATENLVMANRVSKYYDTSTDRYKYHLEKR